ncbi:uncharacterized protein BO87DRAFT_425681 [Aspergillus neoniger CBS 115656]|uniref:Uncharacterized protein n=1 Tax=Aspergillus neoniger (strain CBS 115656) TaxID=1448310 RepID=A0A318YJD0_ASPNB|nr:hypothetical protein BO87DRAFT_425681 [Aspergillus neoniger CBS 115656]PYH34419.1 hypothetical protein BO87DRAFT_425681 [Aspergillus neoniger CBS 115656]
MAVGSSATKENLLDVSFAGKQNSTSALRSAATKPPCDLWRQTDSRVKCPNLGPQWSQDFPTRSKGPAPLKPITIAHGYGMGPKAVSPVIHSSFKPDRKTCTRVATRPPLSRRTTLATRAVFSITGVVVGDAAVFGRLCLTESVHPMDKFNERAVAVITDHNSHTSQAAIDSYEICVPVIVGIPDATNGYPQLREQMKFTDVVAMTPFCRTVGEAEEVLQVLADHGLQVHSIFETSSNIVLAEQFLAHFDAFSIGLKDLTQLTLGFIVTRMG